MATGAFPLCGIERNHDHIQRQYRESRQAATKIRCIERESRIRSGDQVPNESRFSDIIGSSPALQFVLAEVERVAATDSTVLVLGETGTAKELIARSIRNLSARLGRPFVKLNCAAIPFDLLESELFGHEKGAFTGAIAQRVDRFELANGGAIFLDEVGEVPVELQPKLLRVLQEREFERLGRKRAEQELQQLVDFVPQIIVVLSPDGTLIHFNRVAREYIGLAFEQSRSVDLMGKVIHPDDLEKMRAACGRGLSANDPFEIEARLLGADGIYRWFLFRYNPLVEEGRVNRWYATGTDIESRKQEEERVRKENVRLEERTRIAQELHDTLLQTFMGASLQLGAAMNRLPSDSPVKPELDRILQLMEQGIEEGRNAIQGLRSSDSRTLDLVLALSGVQQELAVQPDVDFRVIVAGRQLPLRPAVRQEIYRIGREALVNAFCHSGAKRVELELEYADSNLTMRVRDNGCGIDPQVLDSGREGHWGLAGMRERATRIGGLLKISSNATAGTQVQLSIPSGVAFQLSFTDHGFVNDFHSQPLTTAAV